MKRILAALLALGLLASGFALSEEGASFSRPMSLEGVAQDVTFEDVQPLIMYSPQDELCIAVTPYSRARWGEVVGLVDYNGYLHLDIMYEEITLVSGMNGVDSLLLWNGDERDSLETVNGQRVTAENVTVFQDNQYAPYYWSDAYGLMQAEGEVYTYASVQPGQAVLVREGFENVDGRYAGKGGFGLADTSGLIVSPGCEQGYMLRDAGGSVTALALYDGNDWLMYAPDGRYLFTTGGSLVNLQGGVRKPYGPSEGVFAVNTDEGAGFVDLSGQIIGGLVYEQARPVYHGQAWVKENGQWRVISVSSDYQAATPEPAPVATAQPVPQPLPTPTAPPAQPYSASTLQKGDRGDAVSQMQTRLSALNYYALSSVDGDYGNMTRDAVKVFQSVNGLGVTGVADTATQSAIASLSARPYTLPQNADPVSVSGATGDGIGVNNATSSGTMVENDHGNMIYYSANWVLNDRDGQPWADHGQEGWVQLNLSGKRLIGGFSIKNGYQLDSKRYYGNYRASAFDLYADGAYIGSFNIEDSMGTKYYRLNTPVLAQSLRFEIRSVYDTNHDRDICITAMRLFE